MCRKTLNPRAKPWVPLSYKIYHKPPPVLQPPPPLTTTPDGRWIASPPFIYHNEFVMPYNSGGVYPHMALSYYNTQLQPVYAPTQCYPLVYPGGFDCGATAVCGGGCEKLEKSEKLDREGMGVKRVAPRGFLSQQRGETCRKSTRWAVWMPKSCNKSDEDAAAGDSVYSSTPPPPSAFAPLKDGVPLWGKTTVMIRNIPNQYRRNMLVDFLDKLCQEQNQKAKLQTEQPHLLEYDFLYLPIDFRSGDNLGYAFVNFTNAFAATRIQALLQNYRWGVFRDSLGGLRVSKKVCEITWARIQGRDELVKHFRNSNFVCYNVDYLPVVFSPPRDGTASFTLPTTIGRCLAAAAAAAASASVPTPAV